MEIKASILDYLGKYENGILVSVGLMYKEKFYNSIFYYTENQMIINVEEKMTKDMGYEIEQHKDYLPLLKSIIEKCEPFEEVIEQLDEIKTNDN
jgi:hypothetical protein